MAPTISLTPREKDVFRLVMTGKRNKEIAEKLCITVGVVEGHVTHILRKLGAASRTEAVYIATKNGTINNKEESHG
jgi:DNA-binding NarL/FixJ family response regulator